MNFSVETFVIRSKEAWKYSLTFLLLQLADLATTMYILGRGGNELNPFMAGMFATFGVSTGLAIKVAFAMTLFCIGLTIRPKLKKKVIVFYSVIIAWNLLNIVLYLAVH